MQLEKNNHFPNMELRASVSLITSNNISLSYLVKPEPNHVFLKTCFSSHKKQQKSSSNKLGLPASDSNKYWLQEQILLADTWKNCSTENCLIKIWQWQLA